jgi:peptidoglycan/xylan/chitin deacetylase (PgdA/CDA1 family)
MAQRVRRTGGAEQSVIRWPRRIAAALLRSTTVNRVAREFARLRGHRLILVYHRIGAVTPSECEVVPTVPVDMFRAQLQALGDNVDLMTLEALLARDDSPPVVHQQRRPAVSVTFDDDLQSHVDEALPVLREFGVPATFFLSGRTLHGIGAYWFQHLESLLIAYGQSRTAALLRLPGLMPAELIAACEQSADLRCRVSELATGLPKPRVLGRDAIAALANAGMTVGFHTVNHDDLPGLDDAALDEAVTRGRADLAAATGRPVRYFAYPYGKADARSAAAVRRHGFDAAFTGRPHPVRPRDDRYRLGRWEPGRLGVDDLLMKLTVRLHRAGSSLPQ